MAIDKLPKNAKEIPDFPGYYATVEGDIWSGPKKYSPGYNKLKPGVSNDKHLLVILYKADKRVTKKVHRLILETFVGPCPDGMEGCHYNDIPSDNELKNLRWDTRSNNNKDAYRNGRKYPSAKLNFSQVRIIKRLLNFGTLTYKEIGGVFNVSSVTIGDIKRGAWQWV